jgi:hypothetical protein
VDRKKDFRVLIVKYAPCQHVNEANRRKTLTTALALFFKEERCKRQEPRANISESHVNIEPNETFLAYKCEGRFHAATEPPVLECAMEILSGVGNPF